MKQIGDLFPNNDPAPLAHKAQAWQEICLKTDCFAYDTECSADALSALDHYLTETIDPRIQSGKGVSKSYSEIYDLYAGTPR